MANILNKLSECILNQRVGSQNSVSKCTFLQNNRCQPMLYCSYQFGANTWSIGIICKSSYTYVRLDPIWGEVGLDVRIKHHLFMPQLVGFVPYLARW